MEAKAGGGDVTNGDAMIPATNGSGKRKAGGMSGAAKEETPTKRIKSDEDEDEDDDEVDEDG